MKPMRFDLDRGFDPEAIWSFPGFGSDLGHDTKIKELRRRFQEEDSRLNSAVRFGGPLVEFDLLPEDLFDAPSTPVLSGMHDEVVRYLGQRTLIRLDERMRWCRCLLATLDLPYDREDIVLFNGGFHWTYASEAPDAKNSTDPLSFLVTRAPRGSFEWFAAKFLAHVRQGKWATDLLLAGDAHRSMDAMREWLLAGETWVEAKFFTNHASSAISGQKVSRGGRKGHEVACGTKEERSRRDEQIEATFWLK